MISASKEGLLIEHGFLNKEATNEIKTLFEKYKKINRNGELEINNNISKENVKEEGVIMDNSQNEKMNEKEKHFNRWKANRDVDLDIKKANEALLQKVKGADS